MSVIKVTKVNKSYGQQKVLANISFTLDRGQKVALAGFNGLGKTTLLKIMAGIVEQDNGRIDLAKGATVAYLPQDLSLTGQQTVTEYIKENAGLAALDHRVKIMLTGFGLEEKVLVKKLSDLSSGQKSKVALVSILLKKADLLLLDEPTNNLDLPALIWLEDFLQESEAAAIIVSHDRRFLDRVVRKILELNWETRELKISGGTYSDYLAMEAKRLARRKLDYRLQQEEIERLSKLVIQKRVAADEGKKWMGTDNDKLLRGFKRDRAKGSARTAKVLEKKIGRMEKLDNPLEREPLKIVLEADKGAGDLDIAATKLVAGYNDGFRVGPVTLDIRFGHRLGILGLNGSGKSTLLKAITGQLAPLEGKVTLGAGVRVGNMMQEHETLPRDKTLLEFFKTKTDLRVEDIYNKLVKFGFKEEQLKYQIEVLSPGARARLLLAVFSVQGVNTLILDEPTNHLDMEALEALEEMLANYTGTVILVTHDRYFIEQARLDYVYVVADGQLEKIKDYREYLASAEARAQKLLRLL
jgi:ATP-binding cassette subfamily F protein 3